MDTSTFDAHGVTFTISSSAADVVAAFDDLLVDFGSRAASPGPPTVRFSVEPTTTDDPDHTWNRVTADEQVVYTT